MNRKGKSPLLATEWLKVLSMFKQTVLVLGGVFFKPIFCLFYVAACVDADPLMSTP